MDMNENMKNEGKKKKKRIVRDITRSVSPLGSVHNVCKQQMI